MNKHKSQREWIEEEMIRFLLATGIFCGLGSPFAFVSWYWLTWVFSSPSPNGEQDNFFPLALSPCALSEIDECCSYPFVAFVLEVAFPMNSFRPFCCSSVEWNGNSFDSFIAAIGCSIKILKLTFCLFCVYLVPLSGWTWQKYRICPQLQKRSRAAVGIFKLLCNQPKPSCLLILALEESIITLSLCLSFLNKYEPP